MALLSCSSRSLSTPYSTISVRAISCSSGKIVNPGGCLASFLDWSRTQSEGKYDFDSLSSESRAFAHGQSQRQFQRISPIFKVFETLRVQADKSHLKGLEQESSSDPVVFGDESQLGGREDSSRLLYNCAIFTPGIASALPLPTVTMHDLIACVVTIGGALGMLRFFDELAKRDVLEKVFCCVSAQICLIQKQVTAVVASPPSERKLPGMVAHRSIVKKVLKN